MAARTISCPSMPATPARHRRPAPALPRVLRAAGLDHRRRRPPGQRAARLGQPDAVVRRALRAARGGHVLRRTRRPTTASRPIPAYHADRPPMPDRLRVAVGARAGLYEALGWKVHGHDGARGRRPDALAARGRARPAATTLILTGDRDMFQCVTDTVHVLMQRARQRAPTRSGPEEVRERYGIDARAGAGLHRPARRPVRRAARRQGHRRRRRPPTCSSARATSST